MARFRLTVPLVVAATALALALSGIGAHGFWFDEAYTARLAVLDWPRLIAGAVRDIHPPGWPLLAGVFARLPMPTEWALRLPSAICFAALTGVLAARCAPAGVALLFYTPLLDQASQARPYSALSLGLVVLVQLVERRWWLPAGVVAGLTASLHALGGALAAAVLIATVPWQRIGRAGLVRLAIPTVAICGWWFPSFAASAGAYIRSPWYPTSQLADWWIVADAGGAAFAAALVVLALLFGRERSMLAPALAVAVVLVGLGAAGVGVEIRKTGLVLLPLLLATLDGTLLCRAVGVASAVAMLALSVRIPGRPDLREAHAVTLALQREVPVISVFASEAAWYFRAPAPLPSDRFPAGIAGRLGQVVEAQNADCIVSVALPGTFPEEADLPLPLRTVLHAEVTGLDVRLVGTEGCVVAPTPLGWHEP